MQPSYELHIACKYSARKVYITLTPLVVIVIMMMSAKKHNGELDWDALDRCWADQYEADYGHHFSDTSEHMGIVSPIPAFIRVGT